MESGAKACPLICYRLSATTLAPTTTRELINPAANSFIPTGPEEAATLPQQHTWYSWGQIPKIVKLRIYKLNKKLSFLCVRIMPTGS